MTDVNATMNIHIHTVHLYVNSHQEPYKRHQLDHYKS
jgi:hypothetical protein